MNPEIVYAVAGGLLGAAVSTGLSAFRTMLSERTKNAILGPPSLESDEKDTVRGQAAAQIVYRDIPESDAVKIRQGRVDRLASQEGDLIRRLASLQDDVARADAQLTSALAAQGNVVARVDSLGNDARVAINAELEAMAAEVIQSLNDCVEHLKLSFDEGLAGVSAKLAQFKSQGMGHVDVEKNAVKAAVD